MKKKMLNKFELKKKRLLTLKTAPFLILSIKSDRISETLGFDGFIIGDSTTGADVGTTGIITGGGGGGGGGGGYNSKKN